MSVEIDIEAIQKIREQWGKVDPLPDDYEEYLGSGVTAYQLWLENRLAKCESRGSEDM